ncbi:MAG: hypothetical protein M1816_008193 [Peltula sp. TS41687]|nr:MAG: hypothetical protein M1816_008193 [Peltula sp. TS41687]
MHLNRLLTTLCVTLSITTAPTLALPSTPPKNPFVNAVNGMEKGDQPSLGDKVMGPFTGQMLLEYLVAAGVALPLFAADAFVIGAGAGLLTWLGMELIVTRLLYGDVLPDAEDDARLSSVIKLAKAKGITVREQVVEKKSQLQAFLGYVGRQQQQQRRRQRGGAGAPTERQKVRAG